MKIEIEKKYRPQNVPELRTMLGVFGFLPQTTRESTNYYWLDPAGGALRLCMIGSLFTDGTGQKLQSCILNHKVDVNKVRHESEESIPYQIAQSMLSVNPTNLSYTRERTSYRKKDTGVLYHADVNIELDKVKITPDADEEYFLEIEVVTDDTRTEFLCWAIIDAYANALHLTGQEEPRSYLRMLLEAQEAACRNT